MPEHGPDDPDYAERISTYADVHRNAWQRTIDDMNAMADEFDEDWEVLTIAAGHTAPESPDAGDSDRFGLTYVVSGEEAEAFSAAFEAGTVPEYRVFEREVSGRVFMLTQLTDPDREIALLLAGSFEVRNAAGLVAAARDTGEMYTHVQTLDGTHQGTFRHEDYERFFPNPERYRNDAGETAAETNAEDGD